MTADMEMREAGADRVFHDRLRTGAFLVVATHLGSRSRVSGAFETALRT